MPNQNNNNTTGNNFSSSQNVSDKHLSYFNQNGSPANSEMDPNPGQQPIPQKSQVQQDPLHKPAQVFTPNQNQQVQQQVQRLQAQQTPIIQPGQPVNPQPKPIAQQRPNQTPHPQVNQAQQPQRVRQQYLNPNNIQFQAPVKPQNMNELRDQAALAQKTLPAQQQNLSKEHYQPLQVQQREVKINTYDVLKLCIYIIPALPVFILLFRSISDEEVLWHTRQSLIAQVVWIGVYVVLQLIGAPLIAGDGFSLSTIWNIVNYGLLIFAGAQAYLGRKYRIPIISDIGITYIDKKV